MSGRSKLRVLPHIDREPYACLKCGHVFDRASGVGSAPARVPTPGSISLCIRCADAAVFTESGQLRPLNEQERHWTETDPEFRRIRGALLLSIAERPS